MRSYTVCRVTLILILYSLALYCEEKTSICSLYILSISSDFLFIGKEDAGRRQFFFVNLALYCLFPIFYTRLSIAYKYTVIYSERVGEFKYLGTILTDQNSIQEETESRLKSGNACYYSVQNLLSSSLLSKNLKIKIYRTIILPVVLYECETRSLALRVERRLRVFENRVLRRIFGPKGTR